MTRLACWGILRSGSGPRVSGFQRRKPGLTIDEGLRAGYDKEKILTRELSYVFIVLVSLSFHCLAIDEGSRAGFDATRHRASCPGLLLSSRHSPT